MANRWGRNAPYGGGYMGSGANVGFYMGGPPPDRRPYNPPPMVKPFYGGYRDDNYNRRPERRDDFRGGKRGPPKARSPIDKRYQDSPIPRRDHRPFVKRQSLHGKYEVKVPRTPFNMPSKSLCELRHAYPRINIAPDFYECSSTWVESFPVHCPYKLGNGTDYHVFHRDVGPTIEQPTALLSPPDADYSFSVRVMLMACPSLAELFKNTCQMADDPNNNDKVPPTKSIHFLVGGRAKIETMAIGGPWSPSLDGPNPLEDPKTLINTAIRTFKGYTGVDLSACTEWVRFMELKYYRTPGTKAASFIGDEDERLITSEKPELVVFFVPNATHLIPDNDEWEKTKDHYSAVLQGMLDPVEKKADGDVTSDVAEGETSAVDVSMEESEEHISRSDLVPTHYSKLDVNILKVNELRNELAARGLDTKGLKVNLVTRLQAVLEEEKQNDTVEESKIDMEVKTEQPVKPTSPTVQTEESKELSEKDRRRLERLYRLGDKPMIVIHPNGAARGGRFDCHRVSLFSLLDYRSEEPKEHNFEVSLFAEQFNEMLQRDCAFKIFKAVYNAPEKEHKFEQDVKAENGHFEDTTEEPDNKRRKMDASEGDPTEHKVRRLRRTIHPDLLFAFSYFDIGHAGYLRESDLCELLHLLGLLYSKSQVRKLVSKVARRDHVEYRNLTDADIVEGDENDVISITTQVDSSEMDATVMMGNHSLFGSRNVPVPSRIIIGDSNSEGLTTRLEKSEEARRAIEFQFFQLKEELEKTRQKLNTFKDTEDELEAQNRDLSSKLKAEQKQLHEYKSLSGTYNHLLRFARDQMERALFDINKQFDKEKAKREAEKASTEGEKPASEGDQKEIPEVDERPDEQSAKVEEKEWQVVDAV